jgi:hypothetical protein
MKRFRLPLVLVVAALLIGAAAWTRFDSSDSPSPRATETTTGTLGTKVPTTPAPRASTTVPAPTTTIAADPKAYADALYGYWQRRDRESANKIATDEVVSYLFSRVWRPGDGWTARGCRDAAGSTYCTWIRPKRQLVMQVRNATGALPVLVVAATTSGIAP